MEATGRKAGIDGTDAAAGYTLAEILVGILIFGLLLGVAVPSYAKAREGARIKEAKVQLEMLALGIRQLAWDTGMWPKGQSRASSADYEVWDLSLPEAGMLSTDTRFSNWQGPYINQLPTDPWGSQFFFDPDYRVGTANRIVVGSFGPNKQGRNLYDRDDIYVIVQ